MLCHQMLSLTMGSNFHTVHPPTGFSQAPLPQTPFPYISLQNLFLLLHTHFFFIRTLKTIEKQILILPFRQTNWGRRARTLTCYPLGH